MMQKLKDSAKVLLAAPFFVFRYGAPVAHYLYLTRIAWLALLTMTALPLLATGGLRTLLLGAYDVSGLREALLIGFTLVLATACLRRARELVDHHGTNRFGTLGAMTITPIGLIGWWKFLTIICLTLNAVAVLRASEPDKWWRLLLGLIAGGILAAALGKVLRWLEGSLSSKNFSWHPLDLITPKDAKGSPGLIMVGNDHHMHLDQGHAGLLIYGIALIIAFLLVPETWVHPLASLLLLITLLTLVLGFVSFVMDRYRVPVIVCVVAYCALMNIYMESDHYYPVWKRDSANEPFVTPAKVVGDATEKKRPIVIVTAAGGGIQSAAWTTRVLHELEVQMAKAINSQIDADAAETVGFHQSVRLISGVSGGSVGALHYVHAYGGDLNANRFDRAAKAAAGSSLQSAVLGLVRDDLLRATMPLRICMSDRLYIDRGWLLQNTWSANAETINGKTLAEASLTEWAAAAANLDKPAVIFNSTIVETGERLSISTVPRKRPPPTKRRAGNFEFTERYQADLQMVTAARLSATFPLVSPATRPALCDGIGKPGSVMPGRAGWEVFPEGGSLLHAVDGGYFDNSGMVGALEWLDEALRDLIDEGVTARIPPNVLIIELSAFQHPTPSAAAVDAGETSRGTIYDLISPGLTIANVRNSGQASFAQQLLATFREKWDTKVKIKHLAIYPEEVDEKTVATFRSEWRSQFRKWFFIKPDLEYAPLSWHLRAGEIEQIEAMAKRAVEKALDRPPQDPGAQKMVQTVAAAEEAAAAQNAAGSQALQNQMSATVVAPALPTAQPLSAAPTAPSEAGPPETRQTNKDLIMQYLSKPGEQESNRPALKLPTSARP